MPKRYETSEQAGAELNLHAVLLSYSESTDAERRENCLTPFLLIRRWDVVRATVLVVGVSRALGMIGGILHAFHSSGFQTLIRLCEFLYRFGVCVFTLRQALQVTGLTGTSGAHLTRIRA
jgi:hypothetical protein